MKLYYIVNFRMPTEKAHGHQIGKMCGSFGAHAEVELFYPDRHNNIKDDIFSFYNLKNNFKVRKIKSFDFLKYEKYLGKVSFWLQSLFFLVRLFFLKIDGDKNKSIIYTRNAEIVWVFSLRGYKTIFEGHEWFNKPRLPLFFLRNVNIIITTNNYLKEEFTKFFSDKKILVAPNGVDLKVFGLNINKTEALKLLDLPQDLLDKKVLLYTGSFKTMGVRKGIEEIISVIKTLDQKDIFFIAVGGSKADIDYYSDIVKSLGLEKQVMLVERQPQIQLAKFYQTADILLMPFPKIAHYEYFMTPLKMFEYMAAAKPIIASNLPSIREILNDNNSFLIEPDNSTVLAEAISQVLTSHELGLAKAKQAYLDVQKYSWEKRAEKIINFIMI